MWPGHRQLKPACRKSTLDCVTMVKNNTSDASETADNQYDWERMVRREQLKILLRQAPYLAAVNIINAVLISTIVGGQVPAWPLAGWIVAVAAAALFPARSMFRERRRQQRPRRPGSGRRGLRNAAVYAGLLGLL